MTPTLRVGILGATGLAGQQVLAALEQHPWFTVVAVGASENSAGKSLGDALRDPSGASRWFADGRPQASLLSLPCLNDEQLLAQPLDLVFSAVSKEVAEVWEPRFAERVPVVSTASAAFQPHTSSPEPAAPRPHFDGGRSGGGGATGEF